MSPARSLALAASLALVGACGRINVDGSAASLDAARRDRVIGDRADEDGADGLDAAEGDADGDAAEGDAAEGDADGGGGDADPGPGVATWARVFGRTGNDEGYGVAVDADGNVFVVGQSWGAVDFGAGPVPEHGNGDVFLASYDPGGALRWARIVGSAGSDEGYRLTVASDGDVYVAGYVGPDSDFGAGVIPGAGGSDGFVAAYTNDGEPRWARLLGGGTSDLAYDVAVSDAGSLTVVGWCRGTVDFGGGPIVGPGADSIFIASYTTDNDYRWHHRTGGTSGDMALGVAHDAASNSYVTGRFVGAVSFGGVLTPAGSSGQSDIFFVSFDADGALRWAHQFGSSLADVGNAVALSRTGDVLLAASFTGAVDFGGGVRTAIATSDGAVITFNAAGDHLWDRTFPGDSYGHARDVALDGAGHVYVAGEFQGTTELGDGPVTAIGNVDGFVTSFDAHGAFRWVVTLGGAYSETVRGVALDATGAVYVTGTFRGTMDLLGARLLGFANDDGFLAKLE